MRNKKIILIISMLLISIFIGLYSSVSLAYFNNKESKSINTLTVQYIN